MEALISFSEILQTYVSPLSLFFSFHITPHLPTSHTHKRKKKKSWLPPCTTFLSILFLHFLLFFSSQKKKKRGRKDIRGKQKINRSTFCVTLTCLAKIHWSFERNRELTFESVLSLWSMMYLFFFSRERSTILWSTNSMIIYIEPIPPLSQSEHHQHDHM